MKKMIKKYLPLGLAALMAMPTFAASKRQTEMASLVDSMASVYDAMYAPALWKKEFTNWSLDTEVNKAKDKIFSQELSVSEYHQVVNQFILSMKDFHVSVKLFASEEASLPFMVRGVEGRLFLVFVDREKLPLETFPFDIGDELLELEGVSATEIVKELKSELGGNTSETDEALAQMSLTSRKASKGNKVPKGPVTLTFKKGEKVLTHQLIWNYRKELVLGGGRKALPTKSKSFGIPAEPLRAPIEDLNMSSDLAMDLAREASATNTFALGSKKSFIPALGKKIWSTDEESIFDAYVYLNEKNELVGYIRIPSYGAGEKESLEFKKIMKHLNETTVKLVIDQVNNPGGSVFYLYSLVSMLTDKALATPKHYMAINQKSVLEAIQNLERLNKIKNLEELKKEMGSDTAAGYPLTMNFLEFAKAYYQFYIDEWNLGKTLTSPYHIYGVDKINPHPEVQYTKPILLLVNELDFSGGDFFPAILQDNKRATILGVRTSGAGGYVLNVDIPNQLGVGTFRYTGSLADRVDNTPIENLGVKPDIEYQLTVEDFQKGFKSYISKINSSF